MGKRETALQKAGKNSKAIWAIIVLLGGIIVGMYKIAIYIKDTSGLPDEVKELKKDNEKYKPLLVLVPKLEERQSALELQLATSVAEIKTLLLEVRNNQNTLNEQVIRAGLEHRK